MKLGIRSVKIGEKMDTEVKEDQYIEYLLKRYSGD